VVNHQDSLPLSLPLSRPLSQQDSHLHSHQDSPQNSPRHSRRGNLVDIPLDSRRHSHLYHLQLSPPGCRQDNLQVCRQINRLCNLRDSQVNNPPRSLAASLLEFPLCNRPASPLGSQLTSLVVILVTSRATSPLLNPQVNLLRSPHVNLPCSHHNSRPLSPLQSRLPYPPR
jgi:hypothetical protein